MKELKQPRLRIVLNIGLDGATDKYCGRCRFQTTGRSQCLIYQQELDWNPDTIEFKRCDECLFDTINDNKGDAK